MILYICTIKILIITIIIKDLITSFTFLDYYNNYNLEIQVKNFYYCNSPKIGSGAASGTSGTADIIEQKFFEKLFKNVLTFPPTYAIIKAQGKT